MYLLSSFSSQKDKTQTPFSKNKLSLINFPTPQKPIIKLELTEKTNTKKKYKKQEFIIFKNKKINIRI